MDMTRPMNEQIVETLYHEAIDLAEYVRAVFAGGLDPQGADVGATNPVRIALSIEGMRATTRIMNVLAWLLNQRAFFNNELSKLQLLRRNKLSEDRPSDTANLSVLEPETRLVIEETERLHARVARLDAEWREQEDGDSAAVQRMQDRITTAFTTG